MSVKNFQKIIYGHYHVYGRKLAWRAKLTTPYQIVVSEIMLQQTQVDRIFVATVMSASVLFEGKSWKWFGITAGYQLVNFIVVAAILAMWNY